jgi:deoxyribose-phosphate aldolase
MRANTPQQMEVKASGGVRDIPTLLAMAAEGVTRIGTSSTAGLLAEAEQVGAAGLVVPEPGQATDAAPSSTY